jgi:hypothetical protein
MTDRCTFDYAIIRVVPRVEREEFLNAGAIVLCTAERFLQARVELDRHRLAAFVSSFDADTIQGYLDTIPAICAGGPESGPIGQLPQRARFHWLVAPRSTVIQMSPVHTGLCTSPESALEHLLNTMVRWPPQNIT